MGRSQSYSLKVISPEQNKNKNEKNLLVKISAQFNYDDDDDAVISTLLLYIFYSFIRFQGGKNKVKIGKHVTKKNQLNFVNATNFLWIDGKFL
jgi:hypothetical protein